MRRSLVIVNLILLVAAGFLGYRLRGEWKNYRARVEWIYHPSPVEQALATAAGTSAPSTESWGDIVAHSLFSSDRSSTSAVSNAPPPEPILFGTMNLGSGPVALMSESPDRGFRQVHLGETIGGYKLVGIEGQKVVLEWPGGQIKLDAAESASRLRAATSYGTSAPTATSAPAASAAGGSIAVVSPSSPGASEAGGRGSSVLDRFPELRGHATREQLAELEREPPGTIRNGKRKVVKPWPFGVQIWWEDVKPTEEKK